MFEIFVKISKSAVIVSGEGAVSPLDTITII